ncbi:MAG: tetratricopeptide repeat protein [Bacteroidetes bacterium]|nr:tetratricopeptide repeat protein [Bacteroidota bacterium]
MTSNFDLGKRFSRTIGIVLVALFSSIPIFAQDADPMTEGILAFRSGNHSDAVTYFEEALKADPTNAEAHFLLARLYWETDLRDPSRAGKELEAALAIEPNNVQYMVALLQQLRAESRLFMVEQSREARRRRLAVDILKLDETNSFAHEELGATFIRDFWRYRNAFMYPALDFLRADYRSRTEYDPMAGYLVDQANAYDLANGGIQESEIPNISIQQAGVSWNPNNVFMADEFDVEALKSQGIPVLDLSERAQEAYDRAIGHLNAALESDPRQRTVYDHLMEIYSLKGEYDDALQMLSQMYVFFPEDPELWTYLGYAHYHSGNLEAASKSFETSFRFMDSETEYAFSHLENILPEDELKRYKEDEAAYTARFWTSKDPRFLTPFNERKIEHYARLTYADLLYGSPAVNLKGWNTERGQILVRYGAPQGDVVIIPRSGSGVMQGAPAKMGSDQDPTGDSGLAIQVGRQGSGWDMFEEANTYNIWDYGDFKFVFEDPFRNGEYRLYSPSAEDIANGAIPYVNDYIIKAKETIRETPERYEYEAPGRQIELPYAVASFKGADGTTDVYVNYAVPITDAYDPSAEFISLTANQGMFVVAENRDMLVERRRTIYGLPISQIVRFDESNLWVDTQRLTTPPGNHEISVEFETAGGGTVAVQRRKVEVQDFSGTQLSMSDILLAYRIEEADLAEGSSSNILRKGLSIQPAPWTVFGTDQPIYIYFEVYNLAQDDTGLARYEVEAELTPKEMGNSLTRVFRGLVGGGGRGVSTGVPISVEASEDGQYLILDADNLDSGLFTLTVKITDQNSGRDVEMTKDLFLE